MAIISPSEVITISVSTPPAGLAPYSVNNLMVLTRETPVVAVDGSFAVYTNPTDVAAQWGTESDTYAAAVAVFAQSPNIISGGGKLLVAPVGSGENLATAIARVQPLVYFGGCGFVFSQTDAEILAGATLCQSLKIKLFVVSSDTADLAASGELEQFYGASLTRARGLLHTNSEQAQAFLWGYAGRAMSTNFSGVNTCQTMHLKQISGVTADGGLTSAILATAKAAGVEVYGSVAGRSTLLTSGANGYWDDVYNLDAFVADMEVSGFNVLATAGTKVPQTEAGMDLLKEAYGKVCEKYVTNGFIGAGTWTGTGTFGDPEDFRRNILEKGYYIYSIPLSQQTQADREARIAPVCMVAIKYQGAIHSSSVIINVNK
jgi:hypothetical protein